MTGAQKAEAVRLVQAGASQRQAAAVLGVNPVSVGRAAKRAGITYPEHQANADARRGKPLKQTEAAFQAQVVELAGVLRWKVYHTWLSKNSVAGFPDLVLVRQPRVIFAELKTDIGRTTPAQDQWIEELCACAGVETYLWRPSDWDRLVEVLR